MNHINGQRQLADLPTKLHSRVRMSELMSLWGFVGGPLARASDQMRAAALLCLIIALQAMPAEASSTTSSSRTVALAGWDELTVVTVLVCISAVGMWELGKRLGSWFLGIREETAKERRLRKLRDVARSAAQEELDKEALRRELEAETASLRRPLTTALGDPPLRRTLSLRTTATQTPPLPEPETRVETRVVYTDRPVPDEVPISMFWKTTDHRSKVHTSRECHGLRILEQCLRQSTATTAKDAGRYSLDVDEGAQAMACMLPRRGTLTGLKTASNGLSGCVLQLHGVICGGDEALLTRDQHIPKM